MFDMRKNSPRHLPSGWMSGAEQQSTIVGKDKILVPSRNMTVTGPGLFFQQT